MSTVFDLVLGVFREPGLVAELRDKQLPDDLALVIRLAAGEDAALQGAAGSTGVDAETLLEASVFFLQQVLFAPGADAYRVLGASLDSPQERLRENYRWLMKWLHPDHNQDGWEAVYADRVNIAWQDLKTPERRAEYDRRLPSGSPQAPMNAGMLRRAAPVNRTASGPLLSGSTVRRLPTLVLGTLAVVAAATVGIMYWAQSETTRELSERQRDRSDAIAVDAPQQPLPPVVPADLQPTDGASAVVVVPPPAAPAPSPAPAAGPDPVPAPESQPAVDIEPDAAVAIEPEPAPAAAPADKPAPVAAQPAPSAAVASATGTSPPLPAAAPAPEPATAAEPSAATRASAAPAPVAVAARAPMERIAPTAPATPTAAPARSAILPPAPDRPALASAPAPVAPATTAPAAPAPPPVASTAPVRSDAEALVREFASAYAAGDLGRFDRLLSSARQDAATLDPMRSRFRSTEMRYLEIQQLRWHPEAEQGHVRARFRDTYVPRGGRKAVTESGEFQWTIRVDAGDARIAGVARNDARP